MSRHTELALGVVVDSDGNKLLTGSRFEGAEFDEFSIGPVENPGLSYRIENTEFLRCNINPGEFAIRAGVRLQNVLFDSVSSRDSMLVSSSAVFDRVKIKGRMSTGGLWVKPDEVFDEARDGKLRKWAENAISEIDWMIDISDYWGPEVTVLGWPADKIIVDSSRHVLVRSDWNRAVDWDNLGIGPTGFFRVSVRYLRGFGVETGVFSLPDEGNSEYDKTFAEMALLREAGFIS